MISGMELLALARALGLEDAALWLPTETFTGVAGVYYRLPNGSYGRFDPANDDAQALMVLAWLCRVKAPVDLADCRYVAHLRAAITEAGTKAAQ